MYWSIFILLKIISAASEDSGINIPADFLIGTGSSAYQIEGAWNVSDKGENIWDYFTHNFPWKIVDGTNADVTCDSYHKYKEDVQILNTIGFQFYKFSISWTRILPTGFDDEISKDGVEFYNNVIDELISNGIEPIIVLYHWDHPQILEEMGGWLNELMVDWFTNYAKVVFQQFGSKVNKFITFNEPNSFCPGVYDDGVLAPGKKVTEKASIGKYLCAHNILKAHAKAYHTYYEEFNKNEKSAISICFDCINYYPLYSNDTTSAEIAFQFNCGWFAHPIFSTEGDYPEIMKQKIEEKSIKQGYTFSRLPKFTPYWIDLIRGSADFFALNHYFSTLVYPVDDSDLTWYSDNGLNKTEDPSWETAGSRWLYIVPEGFRGILNKLKEEYNDPMIYVLENGYSDSKPTLNDTGRINYIYSYMKEMFKAVSIDGVNVKAYAVWSFIDNYEWFDGYTVRFGMTYVNFSDPDRKRILKKSCYWMKNVIGSRKLVLNFNDD